MVLSSGSNQRIDYLKIRERIAHNAALLHSLNNVPGSEEDINHKIQRNGYQLPLGCEKQLSEDFAFLAANTDNTRNVVAVSIEEDEDKQGMTIRIAANNGELDVVQSGMSSIANLLEVAARRVDSRKDLQPLLLSKIVDLDWLRILSRLRSKQASLTYRKPGRSSVVSLLHHHLNESLRSQSHGASTALKLSRDQSSLLKAMFESFESLSIDDAKGQIGKKILEEMLQKIAGIVDEFDLSHLLAKSNTIDPTLQQILPTWMSKLARYYQLSHSLIDAARDSSYTVFRSIRVATLDPQGLLTTPVISERKTFNEVLGWHTKNFGTKIVAKARRQPWTSGDSKQNWKVHAEIQLLVFYEFQPISNVPRLLSASKSACYLCWLFLGIHDRFQTPRTHRRLYSLWTLPDNLEDHQFTVLLGLAKRLNGLLERQIKSSLRIQHKTSAHAAESVTALYAKWSPSPTLVFSEKNSAQRCLTPNSRQQLSQSNSSLSRSTKRVSYTSEQESFGGDVSVESADPDESTRSTEKGYELAPNNLDDGICITSLWQCHKLPPGSPNYWFRCDRLEIFLEFDKAEQSSAVQRWIGLKCIDRYDESKICESDRFLDLTSLEWNALHRECGSAGKNEPFILLWSKSILVIALGLGQAPQDPL